MRVCQKDTKKVPQNIDFVGLFLLLPSGFFRDPAGARTQDNQKPNVFLVLSVFQGIAMMAIDYYTILRCVFDTFYFIDFALIHLCFAALHCLPALFRQLLLLQ